MKTNFNNKSLQEISDEILLNLEEVTVETIEDKKSMDEFDEKTTKDIICSFANNYNISELESIIVISKIVQDGGTNSSRPNMTRTINGKTYELTDLRQIIRLHDRFGTVRKLAKSMRNIISLISKVNNWPGPLYKDLLRMNPTLEMNKNDLIYCSEFNADNYDKEMPPRIREALQQREQKIRDDTNRFSFQKQKRKKIGKRKRGRDRKY